MKIKRTLGALCVGIALTLSATACGDPGVDDADVSFETEDCDYEDALKSERECSAKQIKAAKALKAKRDAAKRSGSTSGTKKGSSTKSGTKKK